MKQQLWSRCITTPSWLGGSCFLAMFSATLYVWRVRNKSSFSGWFAMQAELSESYRESCARWRRSAWNGSRRVETYMKRRCNPLYSPRWMWKAFVFAFFVKKTSFITPTPEEEEFHSTRWCGPHVITAWLWQRRFLLMDSSWVTPQRAFFGHTTCLERKNTEMASSNPNMSDGNSASDVSLLQDFNSNVDIAGFVLTFVFVFKVRKCWIKRESVNVYMRCVDPCRRRRKTYRTYGGRFSLEQNWRSLEQTGCRFCVQDNAMMWTHCRNVGLLSAKINY